MDPDRLGDEDEPVAGPDLAAEADVLHAAEADEAVLDELDVVAVIARELRGGLADQDARHQRVVGHVAADPELVGLDVLVADDQMLVGVDRDDRRQLLHLEPLRIAPTDPLPIDQDTGGVDRRGIDQGNRRHSRTSFPRAATETTASDAGRRQRGGLVAAVDDPGSAADRTAERDQGRTDFGYHDFPPPPPTRGFIPEATQGSSPP